MYHKVYIENLYEYVGKYVYINMSVYIYPWVFALYKTIQSCSEANFMIPENYDSVEWKTLGTSIVDSAHTKKQI